MDDSGDSPDDAEEGINEDEEDRTRRDRSMTPRSRVSSRRRVLDINISIFVYSMPPLPFPVAPPEAAP
jgi:hypothetical protein